MSLQCHYLRGNHTWSYVSAKIDEPDELNILFYTPDTMEDTLVSQFIEVDKAVRELDCIVGRIGMLAREDKCYCGTEMTDNGLCEVYKISFRSLPEWYKRCEFTEIVKSRYTSDPFNYLHVAVYDMQKDFFDIYLYKEAAPKKLPGNLEYVGRIPVPEAVEQTDTTNESLLTEGVTMKPTNDELDKQLTTLGDREANLYQHIVSLLFTKVVTAGERDDFQLGVKIDFPNPSKVFAAVSLHFLKYCDASLTINAVGMAAGIAVLSIKFQETPHSSTDSDGRKVFDFAPAAEAYRLLLAQDAFISYVTVDIDQRLDGMSPEDGLVCHRASKWLPHSSDTYVPDLAANFRLRQYYKKKGWKDVTVKFLEIPPHQQLPGYIQVQVTLRPPVCISDTGELPSNAFKIRMSDEITPPIGFKMTDTCGGGGVLCMIAEPVEPTKLEVILERIDKAVVDIEHLEWLCKQATSPNLCCAINSRITEIANDVINNVDLSGFSTDPERKIQFVIEKLQWLRDHTTDISGHYALITDKIDTLVEISANCI
jgi:hypothetical protein